MGGFVGNLLGISKPKVAPVSTAPADALKDEQKTAKKARNALLSTEGGILGQELQVGQVGLGAPNPSRDTLMGN